MIKYIFTIYLKLNINPFSVDRIRKNYNNNNLKYKIYISCIVYIVKSLVYIYLNLNSIHIDIFNNNSKY